MDKWAIPLEMFVGATPIADLNGIPSIISNGALTVWVLVVRLLFGVIAWLLLRLLVGGAKRGGI